MNEDEQNRMKRLLQQALLPVADAEPARDLWPDVLRTLDAEPASPPWYDLALAGGLVALTAFFPAAIPVFLYFL